MIMKYNKALNLKNLDNIKEELYNLADVKK